MQHALTLLWRERLPLSGLRPLMSRSDNDKYIGFKIVTPSQCLIHLLDTHLPVPECSIFVSISSVNCAYYYAVVQSGLMRLEVFYPSKNTTSRIILQ